MCTLELAFEFGGVLLRPMGEEPRSLLGRERSSEKFGGGGENSHKRFEATARMWKMALRRGRATSRRTGEMYHGKTATSTVWLCLSLLFPSSAEAGLYSPSDQIILLSPENINSVLINSTAAIVAEFYASWCGHCVAFSPIYKSLARDVKGKL